MKKLNATFVIVSLLIFFFTTNMIVKAEMNISVFVNQKEIHYDAKPIIINGRTMVPIRQTIETLNFDVQWEEDKRRISIRKNSSIIHLKIGSKTAYQNGMKISLDTAPFILNNRTYVPLRFIAEGFNYDVFWNGKLSTVYIKNRAQFAPNDVKIPILMYHHLEHNKATSTTISPEKFREHMIALKNNGFQTITDYQLHDFLKKGTPLPYNPILITFDDGYKSNYIYAYPILKELDMTATVNLITSRVVDEKNKYPDEFPKFSWDEIINSQDVFTFQSHTHNSHYKELNMQNKPSAVTIEKKLLTNGKLETDKQFKERLLNDFITSKKLIEKRIGKEVITLAYPYGEFSEDTIEIAKQAGFKLAMTTKHGKVDKDINDLYQLYRINVHGKLTSQQLINIIADASHGLAY